MVRLSELRKKHGLSQAELGDKVGLSQKAISKYERGTREPDLDTLKKFASLFLVSVDYLLEVDTECTTVSDSLDNPLKSCNIFASNLNRLMGQLSVTELAERTAISRERLSGYLQNNVPPSIDDLVVLADFFYVSVDYLIGHEEHLNYSDDDRELLTYYHLLNQMDKRWIVGQIINIIKNHND